MKNILCLVYLSFYALASSAQSDYELLQNALIHNYEKHDYQFSQVEPKDQSTFKNIGLGLLSFYQKNISVQLSKSCIYHQSCSRYTFKAIESYGLLSGYLWGADRLMLYWPPRKSDVILNKN